MMPHDYDAIIVGFGPSGAVAACLLGQAGLRTLVIDRQRGVYEKPRAIAIDHEILRLFQNLGVSEAVLPYVAPFPASEHFGAQGQLIRRIDMVPPPYPLGYIPSMVFTQPPVEAALRDHAGRYPSVEVALPVTFRGLTQDANGVTIQMQDEDGTARQATAAYVIGCDGASSAVRQALGIAYEDLVFDEPWMVIDVRVGAAGLAKLPQTAAQFCNPERPATFIIGPGNHRRWEIMLSPGEEPRAMEHPDRVWALLSPWITPADATLWRASSYRFHALVAREWRRGRVFIAGDAAHQQPPFIGQGMCQGLRDVANLAWKLTAVLSGDAADPLLDTYAEERGRHVRTLTSRIKAIGHSICERDPAAARERDARLLAEGGGQARTVTRQEIVPPLEAGLLAAAHHRANGTLFPQPWVQAVSGRQRMDDVAGTGWRLILDGRRVPTHPSATIRTIRVLQPGCAPDPGALVEDEGLVAAWFDYYGCVGALVRPDHYVFGVVNDPAAIPPLLAERAARLAPVRLAPACHAPAPTPMPASAS